MTSKKHRIIIISMLIIMVALICWATVNGYAWLSVPVLTAGIVISVLLRTRVKELVYDERDYSIDEKSMAMASAIFMLLAGLSGTTLIALHVYTPDLSLAIGWTLLGSSVTVALLFTLVKLYLRRKMGGKE